MYFELLGKLSEENVRYLLAGGLAANLYGVERATRDIDLIIDFDKENLQKFEHVVQSFGFKERVPVFARDLWDIAYRRKLRDEKNMLAFSYYDLYSGVFIVDVLLHTPQSFDAMWARKQIRKSGETSISIVSVEDLLEMKTLANRDQDNFDIIQLKKLHGKK